MPKTIKVPLSASGINRAIKQVEAYRAKLTRIGKEIAERLAAIGLEEASIRFSGAMYDGDNDAIVSLEATDTGYNVVASGNSVCFIEFGSGVHYNAGGSYPLPKPSGIVGIGQYGHGTGSNDYWTYAGNPGTDGKPFTNELGQQRVLTYGNPAQMPMYYALRQMQQEAEQIVREVFANA